MPAPGAYEITPGINKDGKFMFSKYTSSKATVFNPSRSKRFASDSPYGPGPGHYQPKNDLDDSGFYILSKYKGDGKRTFGVDKRISFVDDISKRKIAPGN